MTTNQKQTYIFFWPNSNTPKRDFRLILSDRGTYVLIYKMIVIFLLPFNLPMQNKYKFVFMEGIHFYSVCQILNENPE